MERTWMFHVSWNESDQVPEGEHCASTSNRNFEGDKEKEHERI